MSVDLFGRGSRRVIAGASVLALAACGGGNGGSGTAPAAALADPASVTHVDPAGGDIPEPAAPIAAAAASTATADTARATASAAAPVPAYIAAASVWRPLADTELAIQPGSALDFSAVLAPYAKRDRALCANWTMTTVGLPASAAEAQTLVNELRRRGYNFVRLHYLDQTMLTKARATDSEFDPVKLDGLFRLTAALSAAGIGYGLDIYSGDGGYMKAATLNAIGWTQGKLRVHYDSRYIADWKSAVDHMLGTVNPYTGKTLLRDPALKLVIGVNEGGIAFKSSFARAFDPELMAPWNAWLLAHYGSSAAWRAAWSAIAPASAEDPAAGSVAQPAFGTTVNDLRAQDYTRFLLATERGLADWMTAYLRDRGFTGKFSFMNARNSWEEDLSRGAGSAVTYNVYHDHPSKYGIGGSITDTSSLDAALSYLRNAAVHRYLDRPFYLTESSQVFWNRYRREFPLAGAFASHQGWEGLCSFGFTFDSLRYDMTSAFDSKRRVESFQMWGDPVLTAADRINAFLYRRGDVAEGRSALGYVMREPEIIAHASGPAWGRNFWPFATKRALLYKTGIVAGSKVSDAGNWIGADPKPPYSYFREPFRNVEEYEPKPRAAFAGVETLLAQWYEVAARARDFGGIDSANLTDAPADIIQSDSKQIYYDLRAHRARVVTPKSEVVMFGDQPTGGRTLWLVAPSTPNGTVSVHSLDDRPLTTSDHLLLVHLSDARNSKMQFADAAEKTIAAWGSFPVVIRGSMVTTRIIRTGAWKLYALDLRGNRIEERPLVSTGARLEFQLDNTVGGQPVLYYELVKS